MRVLLVFMILICLVKDAYSFSLDGSDIILKCPQRGKVEVILHRYEHTQESWGTDYFETGAGHLRHAGFLIFEFANLDKLFYEKKSKKFFFWYEENKSFFSCKRLSITRTFPINIPYYAE